MFNVADSQRAYEELFSYAPVGDFNRWNADGGEIGFEVPTPRYLTTITHLHWSKGISYTHKMKLEFKHKASDIMNATRGFARSAANTKETYAASFFNTSFTTAWTDAVYFFSASHPLATGASFGGSAVTTCSNLATGALSLTTLASAILLLRKTKDDMGRPMDLRAKYLVVPMELELTAKRLLQSPEKPDDTDRSLNILDKYGIQIVVWPFLSSTTAWYLRADEIKTNFFNREQLVQKIDQDSRNTWNDYHSAAFACSAGAKCWRGWVGSTGT